ncbi:MAG: trypsin-like peptidase domain-containing protein [Micromonosporaceae bacterium]
MRDYENEREQEGMQGRGHEQPPPPAASGQEPPAHETGEQPSAHPAGFGQPEHAAGSAQTDAFWFGRQPPPYAPADQPTLQGRAGPPAQAGQAGQPPPGGGSLWGPPPSGPPPWGTPAEHPRSRARRLVAFAAVAIVGVGVGAAAAFGITRDSQPTVSTPGTGAVPTPGSQRPPLENTGTSKINTPAIANAVSPSVVNITGRIPGQGATQEGTGIVISSSGLVLTNNHVIRGTTPVTAQVDGVGRTYTARVLGTDKTDDVALLQLEGASGLKAASIGDSSKVAIGDPVVAMGNLGGQGGTPSVTTGAITALNRTITAGDQGSGNVETLHGVMQTNAQIGSGDSGGPLANASGQVIGMDTAASSNNFGQSESIGFAIPINHAISIAREIAAGHGSSTIQIGLPAFLGVQVCDVSQAERCMGNGFGFGGAGSSSIAPVSSGALVAGVVNGTPAQSAGIAAGDVITGLGSANVTTAQSLTTAMRSHRPGDSVTVTWVDTNGQRHTGTVTLIKGPAD